jgi:2-dehydropantoate 2-reductase
MNDMEVCVIGAGGIGSAMAAYLSRAGHTVTLVYKHEEEAAAVRKNGLSLVGVQSFNVRPNVTVWPEPIPDCDLLVVAVKTYDTEEALHVAKGASAGVILSAQNGVQKEKVIGRVLGNDSVLGAVIEVSGLNRGNGQIFSPHVDPSHIGELDGSISPRVKSIAQIFTDAGMPAQPTTRILDTEWTKTCQWIATSVMSVMTGYYYPGIFLTKWLSPLFVEIVRDCAKVAEADGAKIIEAPSLFVRRLLAENRGEAYAWLQRKGRAMATKWTIVHLCYWISKGDREQSFPILWVTCVKRRKNTQSKRRL